MSLRSLARFLRLVAACLALAVVSPTLGPAFPAADACAWIAGTCAAGAGAAETGLAEPAARPLRPRLTRSEARANAGIVQREPAGARAVVVLARLYLRHEALLC